MLPAQNSFIYNPPVFRKQTRTITRVTRIFILMAKLFRLKSMRNGGEIFHSISDENQ
jgi:hypothetical protein